MGNQDALAVLVAAEMKKILQKELAPVAPPRLVDSEPLMDEIEALQVWDRCRDRVIDAASLACWIDT